MPHVSPGAVGVVGFEPAAYFFLPGFRALRFVAGLPASPDKDSSREDAVTSRSTARYTLAAIRLFNGGTALFAPEQLARRLGADPQANGAVIYALRIFGIRTVMIGAELLVLRGEALDRSLRKGVLIHASDTVAAAAAGAKGYLPPRTAALTTLISTVNTGLAIAARGRRHPRLVGVIGAAAVLGTGLAVGALVRREEGGATPAAGYRQSLPWRLFDGAPTWLDARSAGTSCRPARPRRAGRPAQHLRKKNLHDTDGPPAVNTPPVGRRTPRNRTAHRRRHLQRPRAPAHGHGRNAVRPQRAARAHLPRPEPTILTPNPREVSLKLLTRHEFLPATAVNVLVAAWLQFMIRDWFSHGRSAAEQPVAGPAGRRRPVARGPDADPAHPSRPDPPARASDLPPTYVNT